LEALSRGARFCLFVDNDADSRALLRSNVEVLALTGVTKIWRRDATALGPMGPGAGGPFDLALLDPPYRKNLLAPALTSLRDGGWLARPAFAVAERSVEEEHATVTGFNLLDTRSYGDTAVDFFAHA
jgi:16S rRNA (guanine966-N2)-methyltransferase